MIISILFATNYTIGFALGIIGLLPLKRFVEEHQSIDSPETLEEYKKVARMNMYLAMGFIVIMIGGIGTSLLFLSYMGKTLLPVVLLANGIVFGMGRYIGHFEKKARNLPTASEELAEAYDEISYSWVNNALPDF